MWGRGPTWLRHENLKAGSSILNGAQKKDEETC